MEVSMLAFALAVALRQESLVDLPRLRRDARSRLEEAHRRLDLGDYAKAVDLHQEGRRLEAKVRAVLDGRLGPILAGLDDESYEARERASEALVALGPCVRPRIDGLLRDELSAEVRARLRAAAERLREVEEDVDGRLRQWAEQARASTEYESDRWSARQAVGRPDSAAGADQATAWASKDADAPQEWLELDYTLQVRPRTIRVHETYNPGALVKVEGRDADGTWRVLWDGGASARDGAWLAVDVGPGAGATRSIRLTLDSGAVGGWNEIDAVELIGDPVF
jgi:hypothetical protein